MKQTAPTSALGANKSRNVMGGFNLSGQAHAAIDFIMFLFGWFTVPIEVIFRRNFGQRWLTVINFYAGLLVVGGFAFFQYAANAIASTAQQAYQQQPAPPQGFWDRTMDKSMLIFLIAYLLIASYHFFRMWWRNGTNTALHSFDDGTSRFEPIAVYLMRLVNILAIPTIRLYMLFLPKEERKRDIAIPPLLNDLTAFTNIIFDPIILIILAFVFPGTARLWLLISAVCLTIYANWKETAKLNKALDFRDTVIEAETMQKRRFSSEDSAEKTILSQATETLKNNPEIVNNVKNQYPDLDSIINEIHEEFAL